MTTQRSPPLDVDIETSILIARLRIEDIHRLTDPGNGGAFSDTLLTGQEYTLRVQEAANLQDSIRTLEDFALAQSLKDEPNSDQQRLLGLHSVENAAVNDGDAVLSSTRRKCLPTASSSQKSLKEPGPSVTKPAVNIPQGSVTATSSAVQSSSKSGPSKSRRIEAKKCVSCLTEIKSRCIHTPCGHDWCGGCLVALVMACMRDETLFPLRCCKQDLSTPEVLPLLHPTLRSRFCLKSLEFATPSPARVYCPIPTCSTFLGASTNPRGKIVCCRCQIGVCTKCKSRAHDGENCAEHAALTELKVLAQKAHWQTCPKCHAIIELVQGCYHMTCRCRAQFCYLCAAPWKTCECAWWDEDHLITAVR